MKTKTPKARVMWINSDEAAVSHQFIFAYTPPALIPCATLKQARQRVRFERMGWEEKAELVARAICDFSRNWDGAWDRDTNMGSRFGYMRDAEAVLLALGHTPLTP